MAETPNEETIKRLKAANPDRAFRLVEMSNEDGDIAFVMTGPTRPEYTKYQEEISAGLEKKTEKEKADALRAATERAALAQIRWPERAVAAAEFDKHPAMILKFADLIHDMAGDSLEVRSKKI